MHEDSRDIHSIELSLRNNIVCSNKNRVGILHLLKNSPENKMQPEHMAFFLGVSHRTVLYHLDILDQFGYVEVRKYKKKGFKKIRSVWGLNSTNPERLDNMFKRMEERFDKKELNELTTKNVIPR